MHRRMRRSQLKLLRKTRELEGRQEKGRGEGRRVCVACVRVSVLGSDNESSKFVNFLDKELGTLGPPSGLVIDKHTRSSHTWI
jgi:hypothetical protein